MEPCVLVISPQIVHKTRKYNPILISFIIEGLRSCSQFLCRFVRTVALRIAMLDSQFLTCGIVLRVLLQDLVLRFTPVLL
jgi:hypothetical protein